MNNPAKLTGAAARVLIAMQTISAQHQTPRITINVVMSTSGMGYSTAHGGLQQLIAAGRVTSTPQPKREGSGYTYQLTEPPPPQAGKSDNPIIGLSDFQNAIHTPIPHTSRARGFDDILIIDDDEHAQKKLKICSVLSEYGIAKSSAVTIAEEFAAQTDKHITVILECIHNICTKTKAEPVWRNPAGVMVSRLRAAAKDQDDPLPLFPQLAAQPKPAPAQRPASRPAYAKKAGSYRRPQVMTTDEERAQDEENARRMRAEIQGRRAARDAVKQGAQS